MKKLLMLLAAVVLLGSSCATDFPAENIVFQSYSGEVLVLQKGFLNSDNEGTKWFTEEDYNKMFEEYMEKMRKMLESQSLDGVKS